MKWKKGEAMRVAPFVLRLYGIEHGCMFDVYGECFCTKLGLFRFTCDVLVHWDHVFIAYPSVWDDIMWMGRSPLRCGVKAT